MATQKKTTARKPKSPSATPAPKAKPRKAKAEPQPLTNAAGQVIEARNLNVTAGADTDVRTGQFCDVVAGEYKGRYGVLTSVSSILADGTPNEVVVHTRDDRDEDIAVAYSDCRPALAGRR